MEIKRDIKPIVKDEDIVKKNVNPIVKGASDFGDTLLVTVLKPALQRTVMELVRATCQEFTKAVEKKIFGREIFGDSLFSTGPLGYGKPSTQYNKIRNRDPYAEPKFRTVVNPNTRMVKDISFASYEAAKKVVDQLENDIKSYASVTVGDYYAYCNVEQDYTDFKYGWTNLNGVQVQPDRHGNYSISLPVPKTIGI